MPDGKSPGKSGWWRVAILIAVVAGADRRRQVPAAEGVFRRRAQLDPEPRLLGTGGRGALLHRRVRPVPARLGPDARHGFLFKLFWGTVTVSIGATLGACAAFWVGRTVARGWVAKKVAGNAKFAAIDEAVGREGFKIVLLTRLSPIFPFNLLNYAFGLTRVPVPQLRARLVDRHAARDDHVRLHRFGSAEPGRRRRRKRAAAACAEDFLLGRPRRGRRRRRAGRRASPAAR